MLPGFQFSTWRDIRRNYQIEYFEYAVHKLRHDVLQRQGTWLLFDYAKGEAGYMELGDFGSGS